MPLSDALWLRHTVATLAYRAEKVLRDVPPGFADFRASPHSQSALALVAHLGDLMEWGVRMTRETGNGNPCRSPPGKPRASASSRRSRHWIARWRRAGRDRWATRSCFRALSPTRSRTSASWR